PGRCAGSTGNRRPGCRGRHSRRTDQATASLTFDEQGTIGTGYFHIRARDRSRTRLANLSYSRPIGSRSSFYLALN
ncbi:hypothetical protein, partial [Pseudomonas aeruginosa]